MMFIINFVLLIIIGLGFILSPMLALVLFLYTFGLLYLIPDNRRIVITACISFVAIALGYLHSQSYSRLNYIWHNNLRLLSPLTEERFYYVLNNHNITLYDVILLLGVYFTFLTLMLILVKYSKRYFAISMNRADKLDNIAIDMGVDNDNHRVRLTHHELNQHSLVIGTTGSGKTSTLLNIVSECCRQNLPLIYLDGKGSRQLADKINTICEQYGRKLKVFTVDPVDNIVGLSGYNPFAFGNFTEWKNKVVTLLGESTNKGQEHFATQEQSYINIACEILDRANKPFDLEGLLAYLSNPEQLQKIANTIDPYIAKRFVESMPKKGEGNDLVKVLGLFYHSHYGKLFSTSNKSSEQIINLKQSLENNEIVLFLFDAASYKRDTSLLGKLVINDINAAFASFGRNGVRVDAYAIFDEFAAYASPNMASILALQRSNGLHAVVGTQSIHAISMESQDVKRIAVELIANCNTFIIHKINDAHDIELLSKTIGSEKRYIASGIMDSSDGERVTVSLKDEYRLDGEAIRSLRPGYGYLCRTVVDSTPQLVKFNYIY